MKKSEMERDGRYGSGGGSLLGLIARTRIARRLGAPGKGGLRGRRPSNELGFTVIELLVSMAVTAVLVAAIYAVYNLFFKQTHIQDLMLEAQQNARAAIDIIEREVINAGFATGDADVLQEAEPNSIEFVYKDPETDTNISATAGQRLKVRYALETIGGVSYLIRNAGICSNDDCTTYSNTRNNEPVIPYATNLSIVYYNIDGTSFAPATQDERDTVRFARIELTTRTKYELPGGGYKYFKIKTHLRIRNIGVGSTATDTTAPTAPSTLEVRDPGYCGRLDLKWSLSTEGDLAGYKIYYGTTSGTYIGAIDVPLTTLTGTTYECSKNTTHMTCTIYPDNPALVFSPSDDSSDVVYYVAVKSYDNSFNHSDVSTEVSGNPTVSSRTLGSGVDDTSIDPVKPAAVTGLIGAEGAAEGKVTLTWDAYDTDTYPDVEGFRIYRSTSEFLAFPIDHTVDGIEWIAGETGSGRTGTAVATDTSYTDSDSALAGCFTYYYAVAPVNCDATLMTDDTGSDDTAYKYVSTDYDITYGDGIDDAAPENTHADEPAGSDTSTVETTAPAAPKIGVSAGWRRVALALTQPSDTDLSHTCVYTNEADKDVVAEADAWPGLQTDTELYPKDADGCYQVDALTSTTHVPASDSPRKIPDSGGAFDTGEVAASQSTAFWHDHWSQESPSVPSLTNLGDFYYRALSFDLCGNASALNDAQASTSLCGDDPTGRPPAVTDAAADCCSSPVTLTWTDVPSGVGETQDMAGYRIIRATSNDAAGWDAAELLNPGAPYWGTSFNDAGVTDGTTYYYRIASTDCYYERWGTGGEIGGMDQNPPSSADIISDINSGVLSYAQVGPVNPGTLVRDEMCPGATGCTKDEHREVLTGTWINSDGTSDPIAEYSGSDLYYHYNVTAFLENNSASWMTITGITVSWVNTDAYLGGIITGEGSTGAGIVVTSIDPNATVAITDDPYRRQVADQVLSDHSLPATTRHVPISLFFFSATDGTPIDMRDDQLRIELEYTNVPTSTTGCVTYLTNSETLEGIPVPRGPSATSTQQDKPEAPTYSYAVPGVSGLNTVPSGSAASIEVLGGTDVDVTTTTFSNTVSGETGLDIPVTSATLYYTTTANTVTTAPTTSEATYTAVAMTESPSLSGTWTGTIPNSEGYRVWYFIVVEDEDGNWDRDPEQESGYYVYDQKAFDVCDFTPEAPTDLALTVSGAGPYDVEASWTAPTFYDDGTSIPVGDTLTYDLYRNVGGVETTIADIASSPYTDAGLIDSAAYTYYVRAKNSCASPSPNVSDASDISAACVGVSSRATFSVSTNSILQGGSFTVTITDCLAISQTEGADGLVAPFYIDTVETVNTSPAFTGFAVTSHFWDDGTEKPWPSFGDIYAPTITETGAATGQFITDITSSGEVTDTGVIHVMGSDEITVLYPFADVPLATISVTPDPCSEAPGGPSGLTGTVAANNKWVDLSWSAASPAPFDLAGYRIYERVDSSSEDDWFLRTSVGAAVTSIDNLSADQGNFNTAVYDFKVVSVDSCPLESTVSSEWSETE